MDDTTDTMGPRAEEGLTVVEGLRVGHCTLPERPTGCTVILADGGAVGGGDVRGGAPGTRETALLDAVNTVQEVHAVVLSGGSAFGLDAAGGVMRYLEEQGVGLAVGPAKVPIVVGAILFDLFSGGSHSIRPGAEHGYQAAAAAHHGPVEEGSVGAGAGATVGKLAGVGRAMKGGIGTASYRMKSGLTLAALIVVNAVGDILDPATGRVKAGVRTAAGDELADARRLLWQGDLHSQKALAGGNTTIGVVATNAPLSKAQANRLAQMAHDGLARAIYPVHTPMDGDTLFTLATGRGPEEFDFALLGALAAELTARAVVRAVEVAEGLPGYPSVRDLFHR